MEEPIAFANLSILVSSAHFDIVATSKGQMSQDGSTVIGEETVNRQLLLSASWTPNGRTVYQVEVHGGLAGRLRFTAPLPGEEQEDETSRQQGQRIDYPQKFAEKFQGQSIVISIPFSVTSSDGDEHVHSFLTSANRALEAIRLINARQDPSDTLGSSHDPFLAMADSGDVVGASVELADLTSTDGTTTRHSVISWSPAVDLKGTLQDPPQRFMPGPGDLASKCVKDMEYAAPRSVRLAHQAEARKGWKSVEGAANGSHLQYTMPDGSFFQIRLVNTVITCCVG